ncbi:MAG: hypothetical protein MHM6MM_003042 [Cercozoa sp. M6MM]
MNIVGRAAQMGRRFASNGQYSVLERMFGHVPATPSQISAKLAQQRAGLGKTWTPKEYPFVHGTGKGAQAVTYKNMPPNHGVVQRFKAAWKDFKDPSNLALGFSMCFAWALYSDFIYDRCQVYWSGGDDRTVLEKTFGTAAAAAVSYFVYFTLF